MASSTTTTYLNIESVGADKLIASMTGLRKSLNFVAVMLKDLNKGLGISSSRAKEGSSAMDQQAKSASHAAASATQLRIAMAAQMAATDDLARSVQQLSKEQQRQGNSLDWTALASKITVAKQAYDAIKGALVSVGQEALKVSQAWDIQRQAEETLQASLSANNITGTITDYKEWASQIQATTTAGDELVLSLSAQAARFAGSEESTKDATKAALDYAAATGGDASRALKSMQRALGGNGESLRQLGISLSEAEQAQFKTATTAEKMDVIIQKLTENYGGFSEALAKTPTGMLTQCQNILGDIEEQVGRLVSPALYAGLSVVKDYLIGQQKELGNITNDARNIMQIQYVIVDALSSAYDYVVDIQSVLVLWKNSVEIFVQALVVGLTTGLKPVGLLVGALGKLPGLSDEMREKFANVGKVISGPFDFAVKGIKSDVQDIKTQIDSAEQRKNAVRKSLQKAMEEYANRPQLGKQGQGQGEDGETTAGKDKKEANSGEDFGLSFEMKLDASTQAYLDYEQKLLDIKKEYTEKRMALEQSDVIDQETKVEEVKNFTIQEQEAIRQVKLQYAKETGDQLTLLDDKYRQDRLAKEKEAEEQLRAEQMATLQKFGEGIKGVTDLGMDMFTSFVEGTGDWREQLYNAMKSWSVNMMKNAVATIIDSAIKNQALAQESQAGIPIVGPILALVAGAAMFATTMALKSKLKQPDVKYATGGYISAGMVRGGAWGQDSVPALLEPGERVLSKAETEAYDTGRSQPTNIVINVNVSGQLSTPAQVTDTVRRVLVPELRAAVRAGYSIG